MGQYEFKYSKDCGKCQEVALFNLFLGKRNRQTQLYPPMEGSQHAIDNLFLCMDIEINTTAKLFRLLGSSVSLCAQIGPKLFPV